MSGPLVLVKDVGAVRVVTLNRPDKLNAIDVPLRLELAEAIEAADADDSVRAIVLTGAGTAFCAGGDISTMERMAPEPAMERARLAQRVIRAIWSTPKPVVAAVEGSAYGAGTALAIACDRVVAASDARFATTFTAVGLAGDMGTFISLPARVGTARARQMMMLPSPIDAEEAVRIGLIDSVVSPGTSFEAALADAGRLASGRRAHWVSSNRFCLRHRECHRSRFLIAKQLIRPVFSAVTTSPRALPHFGRSGGQCSARGMEFNNDRDCRSPRPTDQARQGARIALHRSQYLRPGTAQYLVPQLGFRWPRE